MDSLRPRTATKHQVIPAYLLLAGDLFCILLFAVAGSRSHADGLTIEYLLRAAGPFMVAWLASALAFGVYRRGTSWTAGSAWKAVLEAWLPAWLLGMALRSLVFGRPFVPAFAVVSLVF